MEHYFYESITSCFGNAVFTRYGSVGVALYKNDEDHTIHYIVYDIPHAELDILSETEQKSHIVLTKTYDISDINFDNKMSVLTKINELVTNFEITIYHS